MTSLDWTLLSGTAVFYGLIALVVLASVFFQYWMRDKRTHRPRAEQIALMERLRAESGYDPSLPREPK